MRQYDPNEKGYDMPDEYRVMDEDTVRNNELARLTDGAVELDLNRRRNVVPETYFGMTR